MPWWWPFGKRTSQDIDKAKKLEAIIADLQQIKGIITEKKPDGMPDKSEFERALKVLVPIVDYFKSAESYHDYVPYLMVFKNEISNVIGYYGTRLTSPGYPYLRAHIVGEIDEIIAILNDRLKIM